MTHTIVEVRDDEGRLVTKVVVGCPDTAIDFGHWLVARGYGVCMFDDLPDNHPRTPREKVAADALAEMYARSQ